MSQNDLNSDVSTDDIFAMLAGDILPAHIHARRRAESRGQKIADAQLRWEAHYEQFPTVKLLDMRGFSTPFETMCVAKIDDDGNDVFAYGYGWHDGSFTEDEYVNMIAKERALKAVLNRRPHVPNKIEKETARRAAATAHHGPKKKGGNKWTNRERLAREQKLEAKRASRRSERHHKKDFCRW